MRSLHLCLLALMATLGLSAADPSLVVADRTVSLCYQIGTPQPPLSVFVVNSNGPKLDFTVTAYSTWAMLTPPAGTTPAGIGVGVDPTGLTEGVYTDTLSITPDANTVANSASVNVKLVVSTKPCVSFSPRSLNFAYRVDGARPDPICVSVSGPTQNMPFTATTTTPTWLAVTPNTGTLPGQICATVNPRQLQAGSYDSEIVVTSPQLATATTNIPVSVQVLTTTMPIAPVLKATPGTIYFDYRSGATQPAPQLFSVYSTTTSAFVNVGSLKTPWYAVSVESGTTPATFVVLANPNGLAPGTYVDEVPLVSSDVSPSAMPKVRVVLTVRPGPAPSLIAGPALLNFTYKQKDPAPAPQQVTVRTIPEATVPYSVVVTSGASWLSVRQNSGLTTGNFDVVTNPVNLPVGFYTGSLTVTSAEAADNPRTISVTMAVTRDNTPPSLSASPNDFSSTIEKAESATPTQLRVTINSSGDPLTFQVSTKGGDWLNVDRRTGITPLTITALIDVKRLAAGLNQGAIVLDSFDSLNKTLEIPVNVRYNDGRPVIETVVNGASRQPGPIAPGEMVIVTGVAMGPETAVEAQPDQLGYYPRSMSGTRVLVDGQAVPLLYSSRNLVSFLAPMTMSNPALLVVEYNGNKSDSLMLQVADASPGIAIEDGIISPGNQVKLLLTGFGKVAPPIEEGRLTTHGDASPVLPVTATIGGLEAKVISAKVPMGSNPGIASLIIQVPEKLEPGKSAALAVQVGGYGSPQLTVAVDPPAAPSTSGN